MHAYPVTPQFRSSGKSPFPDPSLRPRTQSVVEIYIFIVFGVPGNLKISRADTPFQSPPLSSTTAGNLSEGGTCCSNRSASDGNFWSNRSWPNPTKYDSDAANGLNNFRFLMRNYVFRQTVYETRPIAYKHVAAFQVNVPVYRILTQRIALK